MTRRDGEADDEPWPETTNAAAPAPRPLSYGRRLALADEMRAQLLSHGIDIDADDSRARQPAAPPPVDRDEIRRLLVAAGVSGDDLERMTAEMPTVEAAQIFRFCALEAQRGTKGNR